MPTYNIYFLSPSAVSGRLLDLLTIPGTGTKLAQHRSRTPVSLVSNACGKATKDDQENSGERVRKAKIDWSSRTINNEQSSVSIQVH
jgi:hypothetical protein